MKRIIVTASVLLLAAAALYAQMKVQDTFLGLRFGQNYERLYDLKKQKGNNTRQSLQNADEDWYRQHVQIHGVEFGGRRWDYVDFYFSPSGSFYMFRAYEAYNTQKDAEKRYDSLVKDLSMKYGGDRNIIMEEDGSMKGDREKSVTYKDAGGRTCKLCVRYTESKSFDMYYYVMLYYYDQKLQNKADAEFVKEL